MRSVTTNGVEIPALGFGTWPMTGRSCQQAVEDALAVGYRHIDTAQMYNNEAAVGKAIANAPVSRDEVFLVTKLRRQNLGYNAVLQTGAESRDRLGTDIDLLLIHHPNERIEIGETIGAMNELQADGVVDHIGVSNFSIPQLSAAMDASSRPVITNQVEYHPFVDRGELLEFCIDHEVMLTAYSPLARGDVLDDNTLTSIGESYGKSPAQVALRWLLQQPVVAPIPKAASHRHREENRDVFDFELTDEEMERIFELQGSLLTRLRGKLGI